MYSSLFCFQIKHQGQSLSLFATMCKLMLCALFLSFWILNSLCVCVISFSHTFKFMSLEIDHILCYKLVLCLFQEIFTRIYITRSWTLLLHWLSTPHSLDYSYLSLSFIEKKWTWQFLASTSRFTSCYVAIYQIHVKLSLAAQGPMAFRVVRPILITFYNIFAKKFLSYVFITLQ